jgi:hypothetical protein
MRGRDVRNGTGGMVAGNECANHRTQSQQIARKDIGIV